MVTNHFRLCFQCHSRNPWRRRIDAGVFRIIAYSANILRLLQAALTFNKRDLLSVLKPYGIKPQHLIT
jgi:hypothetical protein